GSGARRQAAAAGTVGRSSDRSGRSQRTAAVLDGATALSERRPDAAQRDSEDGADAPVANRTRARHQHATFNATAALDLTRVSGQLRLIPVCTTLRFARIFRPRLSNDRSAR